MRVSVSNLANHVQIGGEAMVRTTERASRQGDYRNPGGGGIEELVQHMSQQMARLC